MRVELEDPSTAVPVVRHPDPADEHGRGVLLIDELADAWGVEPRADGKTVWFEIDVSTATAEVHGPRRPDRGDGQSSIHSRRAHDLERDGGEVLRDCEVAAHRRRPTGACARRRTPRWCWSRRTSLSLRSTVTTPVSDDRSVAELVLHRHVELTGCRDHRPGDAIAHGELRVGHVTVLSRGEALRGSGSERSGGSAYTRRVPHCARSSTDRASDYGSEGWGFESLRSAPRKSWSGRLSSRRHRNPNAGYGHRGRRSRHRDPAGQAAPPTGFVGPPKQRSGTLGTILLHARGQSSSICRFGLIEETQYIHLVHVDSGGPWKPVSVKSDDTSIASSRFSHARRRVDRGRHRALDNDPARRAQFANPNFSSKFVRPRRRSGTESESQSSAMPRGIQWDSCPSSAASSASDGLPRASCPISQGVVVRARSAVGALTICCLAVG